MMWIKATAAFGYVIAKNDYPTDRGFYAYVSGGYCYFYYRNTCRLRPDFHWLSGR
ncbi:MAG: hypothetical protein QM813_22585 [Verrucomicrobiota bacterium]